MRTRTSIELGMVVVLLLVGAALLFARLKPETAPEETTAPTPTPRMLSLIRELGPVERARDLSRPSSAPANSGSAAEIEEEILETGLLEIQVREEDGGVPEETVEVVNEDLDFRQTVENGRLVLETDPGVFSFHARTASTPVRQSKALSARVEEGELARLDLVLPSPVTTAGPGMSLIPEGEYAIVSEMLEDGPAHAAGLRPGDAVLEINGAPITALTAGELEVAMTGAPGERIQLRVVIRNGAGELEEHEVPLTLR